jgi:hypothetical protein
MYRYSLEERVFIVKTYWITGYIENCQRRFVEQFVGFGMFKFRAVKATDIAAVRTPELGATLALPVVWSCDVMINT